MNRRYLLSQYHAFCSMFLFMLIIIKYPFKIQKIKAKIKIKVNYKWFYLNLLILIIKEHNGTGLTSMETEILMMEHQNVMRTGKNMRLVITMIKYNQIDWNIVKW